MKRILKVPFFLRSSAGSYMSWFLGEVVQVYRHQPGSGGGRFFLAELICMLRRRSGWRADAARGRTNQPFFFQGFTGPSPYLAAGLGLDLTAGFQGRGVSFTSGFAGRSSQVLRGRSAPSGLGLE